ncbi:uncharacterized protein [Phyllobates terribilis]|uniref:uncharacterized protein isoform X4 n=1 Tax=Phyllobates terribilis TaxID=111132 RepID=UPI003CCB33B6
MWQEQFQGNLFSATSQNASVNRDLSYRSGPGTQPRFVPVLPTLPRPSLQNIDQPFRSPFVSQPTIAPISPAPRRVSFQNTDLSQRSSIAPLSRAASMISLQNIDQPYRSGHVTPPYFEIISSSSSSDSLDSLDFLLNINQSLSRSEHVTPPSFAPISRASSMVSLQNIDQSYRSSIAPVSPAPAMVSLQKEYKPYKSERVTPTAISLVSRAPRKFLMQNPNLSQRSSIAPISPASSMVSLQNIDQPYRSERVTPTAISLVSRAPRKFLMQNPNLSQRSSIAPISPASSMVSLQNIDQPYRSERVTPTAISLVSRAPRKFLMQNPNLSQRSSIAPISPASSMVSLQNIDQPYRSERVTPTAISLVSRAPRKFLMQNPNLSQRSSIAPISPASSMVSLQNIDQPYRSERVTPTPISPVSRAPHKFLMQNPNLSQSSGHVTIATSSARPSISLKKYRSNRSGCVTPTPNSPISPASSMVSLQNNYQPYSFNLITTPVTRTSHLHMQRPICLIENIGGNTLVLNKEAEKILLEISQPVVVIAIVGKYRTGKSYLMNKLAGKNTGFPLGSTIQSKTKGIWMWCVPHPCKPGQTLVLLDTEGLGDVEKGDSKNDAWIFSLAVLLSSSLVFNSLGTIDQQAMEQLHYVTELTKRIKLKASSQPQDETGKYNRYFPSFTWCVRDFTLTLEKNGRAITEDEYLMSSLELKSGTDKTIKDYNLPRECILQFFHTHKCFVFDRPASRSKLQKLEELQESELEEDFVEQAARFYSYMINGSRVKTLNGGTEVTGRMLAILTASYLNAIQSGTVPCIQNAVLALAEIENTGALQDALSKYQCEMEKHVLKFPTETHQHFLNMHMVCEKEAITVFMGRSLNDKDQKYQQKLKELIDNKMNEYSAKNEKASRDFCQKLLQKLRMSMKSNLFTGNYYAPGGHQRYVNDKLKVIETYNTTLGKGMMALEVMQEFMSDTKDTETAVLQADKTLTQNQRRLEEERARAENTQREKQIMEQTNRNLQQCLQNQQKSFEQHKAMLMVKMEQERQNMIQKYELLISQKLKEQEKMMSARFESEISDLQRKLDDLHKKKTFKNIFSNFRILGKKKK